MKKTPFAYRVATIVYVNQTWQCINAPQPRMNPPKNSGSSNTMKSRMRIPRDSGSCTMPIMGNSTMRLRAMTELPLRKNVQDASCNKKIPGMLSGALMSRSDTTKTLKVSLMCFRSGGW